MKYYFVAFLTYYVSTVTSAQVQIGVWTEKSSYHYGDTIGVTVTAYNPTADTVVLGFPSSCQANYIIDDFNFYDHIDCAMILSSRKVPPFQTVSWDYLKYPYGPSIWPLLSVGAHIVIGEVLGYGRSDTLVIFVTSPTSASEEQPLAGSFLLGQNYPNPFNGTTTIPFAVSTPGRVVIRLYNSIGQNLRMLFDEYCRPGSYAIKLELDNAPSGVYWCRLECAGRTQTAKLILSR